MKRILKIASVIALFVVFLSTDSYAGNSVKTNFIFNTDTNSFERISGMNMQDMYLLSSASLLESAGSVSGEVENLTVGDKVSVIAVEGSDCYVISESGRLGYINIEKLTSQMEYVFNEITDSTKYVSDKTDLLVCPNENAAVALTLDENETVQLTGSNELDYWRVVYNDKTYYVNKKNLNDNKIRDIVFNTNWNGRRLTKSAGTIIGPSGKETYYNLNMKGVVSIMRGMGNKDEYWIRSDGVKMLGDYVMVAAHLGIRPRGSLVPTSLGMGIVCDTGTFIYSNKTQLDIAVAW